MAADDIDNLRKLLAARDAEIAELRAENAKLRPIVLPAPSLDGPWQVPSFEQVGRLADVVVSRFPRLKPKGVDHSRFLSSTLTCMRYLGGIRRLPPGKTDDQYKERWRLRCEEYVRAQGISADVSFGVFFIAVVASGDITYYSPDELGRGGPLSFGLSDGVGRRARNSWLSILETGRLHAPLCLPTPEFKEWRPAQRRLPVRGNEAFWTPGRFDI
jgi:hypothetical protein